MQRPHQSVNLGPFDSALNFVFQRTPLLHTGNRYLWTIVDSLAI